MRPERICSLGMSLTSTAASQNNAIPANPARKDAPARLFIIIAIGNGMTAIIHHGRNTSATADKTAMISMNNKTRIKDDIEPAIFTFYF